MDESLNQERETSSSTVLVFEPRRALALGKSWIWVRRAELICTVLLAIAAFQMLAVIGRKTITIDEIVMIPSAYYHLVAGNFQLVSEHPPLSKILAATGLLFVQPNEFSAQPTDAGPQPKGMQQADHATFWSSNQSAFETISYWARVPMILLTVVLGVLIFVIARSMFGPRAAVFAVALFSFEPTVLAHGRVVQTDVVAAFGYLLFAVTLYSYVRKPIARHALWLGVATGVAILAKFSMLLTGPILVVTLIALLWHARRKQRRPLKFVVHAALVTVVVLLLVNAAYFFHSRSVTEGDVLWARQSFPAHNVAVLRTVRASSYILPTDFVMGIFWQAWHNREGHPASLLGKYSSFGWWYYFPVAFALKTTLPFLLISIASLAWATHQLIKKRDSRYVALLVPFAIYSVFVLFSNINIGVRYYLPALPFLFILGGAFFDTLLKAKRARVAAVAVVCALFIWIGVETARAFPNQMTYMNQLASNQPHWWYLSDSNIEWGDDTKELVAYLQARGEKRVQSAFLGDFFLLNHYGVESVSLISSTIGEPPATRYAAIGASYLNGSTVPYFLRGEWPTEAQRVNYFDQFRHRTPETIIGNSIYVYRMQD